MNKLQLTLAILKPEIVINEVATKEITQILLNRNFLFVRTKLLKLTLDDAKSFYEVHKNKFFYNRLIYSMSSGLIRCHILAKDSAISEWRKLMGPTKVFKTIYEEPLSIRGKYGITDTRNVAHGSDSIENAINEIKFFFPDFDYQHWMNNEEIQFRNNNINFDDSKVEHFILNKN